MAHLNKSIRERGYVLWDRQVLTTPLDLAEPLDVIFEPESLDETFEKPARSEWGALQRAYFGLDAPYQMADEPDEFTSSHVMTRIVEPYLAKDELIAGVIHGQKDHYYFYCPCHFATVVYTTRHRLVCMSCGATHVVLCEPLRNAPTKTLTARDWVQLFDENGDRRDEEVDLAMIDFRDIENVDMIWTTNQWEEAAQQFTFFARSTPEEIEVAIRGTEADPSIFREAGWTAVEQAPPPALQLMEGSVDLVLEENAAQAFREGVTAFLAAYDRPDHLVSAVPQLFRAIELLLKARLERLDEHALDDHPNNPTVLNRLQHHKVALADDEMETVTRLRRLRNDLQHGTSRFNHRAGLALCRRAVLLIDRFVASELGLWVGDVIRDADWRKLLTIPEIAATAERIVDRRLAPYRTDPDASIETCPECLHDAMLRRHPATGASCAYCAYVPVLRGEG